MTPAEADRAMILQVPVVHQGLEYKAISGLVYRKGDESGRLLVRAELLSACGNSVTIARLDRVGWLNPADGKRFPPDRGQTDEGPSYQERRAKRAFLSGEEIWFEGERWLPTAIILRKWMERVYWEYLELSGISSRQVREVWSGSIVFPELPGDRKQEACGDAGG